MEYLEPCVYVLIDHCPQCGERLCAAWHNRVRGLPVAPVWSVECDNVNCDYVYPAQFATLEDLAKKFEAED